MFENLNFVIQIWNYCFCCFKEKRKEQEKGMSNASELKSQLHVYHDPFSAATSQPKIPDGKTNNSLGFSLQNVREIQNDDGCSRIDLMLFAGQNGGVAMSCVSEANAIPGRNGFSTFGFESVSGVNYSDIGDGALPPDTDDVSYLIKQNEKYALHRIVSTGLQLKLLNSVEEDDGWWEAVRINEAFDNTDWFLTTVNESVSPSARGIISPIGLLNKYADRSLVEDPTYNTGLLRDLNRVQFELHGRLDSHDFHIQRENIELLHSDKFSGSATSNPREIKFESGKDNATNVIENFLDESYDIVYIRLYCRPNNPAAPQSTEVLQGSRFHMNLVSNQEVYFETGQRENRYMTNTYTIGAGPMSVHSQVRRTNRNAATPI